MILPASVIYSAGAINALPLHTFPLRLCGLLTPQATA